MKTVEIEVISGLTGNCLSINGFRVCGPKPYGGVVLCSFNVDLKYIKEALKEFLPAEYQPSRKAMDDAELTSGDAKTPHRSAGGGAGF